VAQTLNKDARYITSSTKNITIQRIKTELLWQRKKYKAINIHSVLKTWMAIGPHVT
jgi:hypothetical protein